MEWLSWTIAIILGVSSIISPIATVILKNIHEAKMKQIETYELSKRNSLENFIKCASKCFDSTSLGDLYDYYNSLNTLYIYFYDIPEDIKELITCKGDTFNNELTKIVQVLSKQIKKQ